MCESSSAKFDSEVILFFLQKTKVDLIKRQIRYGKIKMDKTRFDWILSAFIILCKIISDLIRLYSVSVDLISLCSVRLA